MVGVKACTPQRGCADEESRFFKDQNVGYPLLLTREIKNFSIDFEKKQMMSERFAATSRQNCLQLQYTHASESLPTRDRRPLLLQALVSACFLSHREYKIQRLFRKLQNIESRNFGVELG